MTVPTFTLGTNNATAALTSLSIGGGIRMAGMSRRWQFSVLGLFCITNLAGLALGMIGYAITHLLATWPQFCMLYFGLTLLAHVIVIVSEGFERTE